MNVARRRRAWLLLQAAVVLVAAFGRLPAAAAQASSDNPRPLAVSVPPDAAPLAAGGTGSIPFRIVNPGTSAVAVDVTGGQPQFGDDGRLTISSGEDPFWHGRVAYPAGPITVPPQGYVDSAITVQMPPQIDPDLYFIGFLVTPEASGQGAVKVINQIGSFVTIDVPGPRVRTLQASLDAPGFVFGSGANATVTVTNTGHAQAQFWGETDLERSPGGAASQQRIDKSLLPTGRSRSFTVATKPAWPVGFVTITSHVVYPDTDDSSTKEIVLTKKVLFVSPWVVVVAAGLVVLAGALWWRRRRRRRAVSASGTPRPPREPATRERRAGATVGQ